MNSRYFPSAMAAGCYPAVAEVSARYGVRRQHDKDGRPAVLALLEGQPAVERPRSFRELVQAAPAPLAGRVVGDARLEPSVVRLPHEDGQPLRRPAAHRLVQRLTDDLVQRGLRLLGESLSRFRG